VKAYDELARAAYAALGRLPDSPQIHEVKATILRNQNQHLEAVKEWREAMRLAPGNAAYARELADSLYMAKHYTQALAMFEQFLKADPEAAQLNYLAGDSWLRQGEIDKSIPYLEKAVRRDPKLLQARAALGLAYARAGRSQEAVPHLEAALELDDDGSLRYQLAHAYQVSGRPEQAERKMAEYREIQKKSQAEKEKLSKQTEITVPRP
jgi:tetratricopeptide (TPR) repeat protein